MAPKRKSIGGKEDSVKKSKKSSKLSIGDNVESIDVTLMLENEKETTLSDIVKDKGAVIFMYPRANTPGCTKQACGFRDDYKKFEKLGFDVYGLSYDKPTSQNKWKVKYDLPYHLLTDEGGVAIKAFGASKAPKGIIRSHVVIKKGGEILDVKNKISPADSFTGALETVKESSK